MTESKYNIDMCSGTLLDKMVFFVLPLICMYTLQSLFNMVDMMIIGRFAGHQAMAAIGVTLNPITLVLKIFIGFSTGVNVVVARCCGAQDRIRFRRGVHTAMTVALYGGILMMLLALAGAKPILVLMKTPSEILQDACCYIWIYFLGIPFLMFFHFGCAILRAVGDTRRPFCFLVIAGLVNILLNFFFVAVCRMAVAGVAIATTIANGLSAALILRVLLTARDDCHLNLHHLKIDWQLLREILYVGLPAGINSSFFNVSNMIVQSAINTFGSLVIAGTAASVSIGSFFTVASSAFQQMVMSFTAQNYGAGKIPRVARTCLYGCLLTILFSLGSASIAVCFDTQLLGFFNTDPEVIHWGSLRLKIILMTFFLDALADVLCGSLRGIGYPIVPTVASLIGVCFLRIFWVFCIFPIWGTYASLLVCYPISWFLIASFDGIFMWYALRKIFRKKYGSPVIRISGI